MLNLDNLIAVSMKNGDKVSLKVYRNLKSKVLEYKTSKGAKPYSDEIEFQIISKFIIGTKKIPLGKFFN